MENISLLKLQCLNLPQRLYTSSHNNEIHLQHAPHATAYLENLTWKTYRSIRSILTKGNGILLVRVQPSIQSSSSGSTNMYAKFEHK